MKKIISAYQVKQAAKHKKIILSDAQTLITPEARDLAGQLGVLIQQQSPQPKSTLLHDIYPVKVVAIASDHGGFELKTKLVAYLRELGYIAHDLGPANDRACDYPDYAFKIAEAVSEGKVDRGIMIDSVGIGSAMAGNKVQGVLAAKCNNTLEAKSAREHNYANVLTLGARVIGVEMAKAIVRAFLETPGGVERHRNRVQKILDYSDSNK